MKNGSERACSPLRFAFSQDADKTVIYFGPRAGFEYDQKNKKWIFKYFVEGD